VATIAQIESRAQACLSMTEMQAMTRSVNTGGISHFERRLLQKPNTAAKLALPLLRLGNRTLVHYCDVLLTIS